MFSLLSPMVASWLGSILSFALPVCASSFPSTATLSDNNGSLVLLAMKTSKWNCTSCVHGSLLVRYALRIFHNLFRGKANIFNSWVFPEETFPQPIKDRLHLRVFKSFTDEAMVWQVYRDILEQCIRFSVRRTKAVDLAVALTFRTGNNRSNKR